ncbi:MAG: DUF4922 domain-containing protein [Microcoleaceae cyanobacterium]
MPQEKLLLTPGILWEKIKQQTQHAQECGALQPIPTNYEFVEDNNIHFLVRILSNLSRKQEAQKQQEKKQVASGKDFNPFLPYEQDLFVADISSTHLCLLNKYNVVDEHLLIVTREFEEQENLLTLRDFQALGACMAEFDGLAFYNGGKTAGASQRHKHLQIVPLPLTPDGATQTNNPIKIPIESAIASAKFDDKIGTIAEFTFQHALVKLDPSWVNSPVDSAARILESYFTLIKAVGIKGSDGMSGKQSESYNLLVTREWMLVVPRMEEEFQNISINSLGFVGAMLVKNREQMEIIKQNGPLKILQKVAKN